MMLNMGNDERRSSPGSIHRNTAGVAEPLAREESQASKYLANWQKTEEDFASYRRFAEQQKREAVFANKSLMLSLLTVLDDLERAFKFTPDEGADSAWFNRMRLVRRALWSALETHGLARIDALGLTFDPAIHEAVATSSGEEGRVVEEVQKGYKLRGRVIRPAYVVVGNGKPVLPASDVVRR